MNKIKCLILLGCLVFVSSVSYAAPATTTEERFGEVSEGMERMSISVENGARLIIYAVKEPNLYIFIQLSRGQAVKLIRSIEKALADTKKPTNLSGKQSSRTEYYWFCYGECLSLTLLRESDGSKLWLHAMDSNSIKHVHLKLAEAKAQSFLSILQEATASMKKKIVVCF